MNPRRKLNAPVSRQNPWIQLTNQVSCKRWDNWYTYHRKKRGSGRRLQNWSYRLWSKRFHSFISDVRWGRIILIKEDPSYIFHLDIATPIFANVNYLGRLSFALMIFYSNTWTTLSCAQSSSLTKKNAELRYNNTIIYFIETRFQHIQLYSNKNTDGSVNRFASNMVILNQAHRVAWLIGQEKILK